MREGGEEKEEEKEEEKDAEDAAAACHDVADVDDDDADIYVNMFFAKKNQTKYKHRAPFQFLQRKEDRKNHPERLRQCTNVNARNRLKNDDTKR